MRAVLRVPTFVAIALAMTIGLAACGGSEDKGDTAGAAADTVQSAAAAPAETQPAQAKKAEIALLEPHQANPYAAALDGAVKQAAEAAGAKFTLLDANNDPQKQSADCQDVIASQRANILLIRAVSGPTMVPCARQAIEAGIKVVALDVPIGPDLNTTKPQVDGLTASVLTLASTNYEAIADLTVDACGDKDPCQVAFFFGPPAFTFASEGRKFFNQAIAKHPNIKIVQEASSNFNGDTAANLTQQLLTKYPDVNVIVNDADQAALGSQKAVDRAGKADQIKLIGGGGNKLGAAAIKAGTLYGTSANYPATIGEKGVELGIKALNGEDLGETDINVVDLTPLGAKITKDNIDQYEAQWG